VSPDGDPLLLSAGVSAGQLADVLDLVAGTDIAELEVPIGSTRLSLRRPPLSPLATHFAAPPAEGAQGSDGGSAGAAQPPLAIASPLVGIFRPVVSAGQTVQPGQSIGRVETLGLPTSVDAPRGGTVDELLVGDGMPVEYGQPLLTLRRTHHA